MLKVIANFFKNLRGSEELPGGLGLFIYVFLLLIVFAAVVFISVQI